MYRLLNKNITAEPMAINLNNAEEIQLLRDYKSGIDEHTLVSILNSDFRIVYVNDTFCAALGYTSEELIGMDYRELIHDSSSNTYFPGIEKSFDSGASWRGEILARCKSGSTLLLLSTLVAQGTSPDHPKASRYIGFHYNLNSLAIENAKVQKASAVQLSALEKIQKKMLSEEAPSDIPGMHFSSYTEAYQGVDGDFHAFTRINEGSIEILAGDVMGKGIEAALLAAAIKNKYRKLTSENLLSNKEGSNSDASITKIINELHKLVTPELISIDSFVTLSLMRINRSELTIEYANAGHTPLFIAKEDGNLIRLAGDNMPLGVMETEVYKSGIYKLDVGDTVIAYSDGVTESYDTNGNLYGEERIEAILRAGTDNKYSPAIIMEALQSDLFNFTQSQRCTDDRSVIFIKINPLRSRSRGQITERRNLTFLDFPLELDKLSILRKELQNLCSDQPEAFTHSLMIAAQEAASNIIRHSKNYVRHSRLFASIRRTTSGIELELMHAGEHFQAPEHIEPDFSGNSDGGFGLFIINKSVDMVIYRQPMPGLSSTFLQKHFPIQ